MLEVLLISIPLSFVSQLLWFIVTGEPGNMVREGFKNIPPFSHQYKYLKILKNN